VQRPPDQPGRDVRADGVDVEVQHDPPLGWLRVAERQHERRLRGEERLVRDVPHRLWHGGGRQVGHRGRGEPGAPHPVRHRALGEDLLHVPHGLRVATLERRHGRHVHQRT
jgi:hypothetical protein